MSNEQAISAKASIVFATLAALGLGALIGVSLSGDPATTDGEQPVSHAGPEIPAATGGAPVYRFFDPITATVPKDEFGSTLPVADGENFIGNSGVFRSETLTIALGADSYVEYKATMEQGDAFVFAWNTDRGEAYYDFHAHQETGNPDFFSRYDEGEGNASGGSVVAAYAGQHGWYWLNLEAEEITITLEIAGYFTEIVEVGLE